MPRKRRAGFGDGLAYLVFVIGMAMGLVFTAIGIVVGTPVALLFRKKIKMGDADLTL